MPECGTFPVVGDSQRDAGYDRYVPPQSSLEKRLRSRAASRPFEERLRRQRIAIVVGGLIGLGAVAGGVVMLVSIIGTQRPAVRLVGALIVVCFGIWMLQGSVRGLSIRHRLLRDHAEGLPVVEPDDDQLLAEIRERGRASGEPESRD